MRIVLIIAIVLCLPGCRHDDRIKRAASVFNAKTKTAQKEINAEQDPALRNKIVDEYFRNATEFSQTFEDYVFSRKPTEVTPKKP